MTMHPKSPLRRDTDILLIENCDFQSYPPGGQLSFVRHLVKAFPGRFALVGITTGNGPIGQWAKKEVEGYSHDFFAVGRSLPSPQKRLVPSRLTFLLRLRRWRKSIRRFQAPSAFVLAPESLMAIQDWGWQTVGYNFSGIENPLTAPRYCWARAIARLFDHIHLNCAAKADILFAAADEEAQKTLVERSRGRLEPGKIIKLPTAFDSCFGRISKQVACKILELDQPGPILVASGRLSWLKGWDLLLDAFRVLRSRLPQATLLFVGDGEDKSLLEHRIRQYKLAGSVKITGFQPRTSVNLYLNACDVVVFGSRREGWPTAMVEALACGKPIVSTAVSGAHDLIRQGRNGYIVANRDPRDFSAAIESAVHLPDAESTSLNIARSYSLDAFASRLVSGWPSLREPITQATQLDRARLLCSFPRG